MKITKKQLKRIIKEEIESAMSEGGVKGNYVPFADAEDPANPDAEDIRNETQKLADVLGISFEEADAMVKKKTAEMGEEQPLGEQSTLLNEAFGEIIGAVFANLFAELGFNVATHKSHQRRGPERTSLRSGTESEPEAETGWDSYHRKWSDKFLEDYKAGNLTPKQYEKLESFAKEGLNDRGVIRRGSRIGSSIYKPREPDEAWEFAMREMENGSLPAGGESKLMFQIYKSKHGDPRHGVPKGTEGIRERKITKKQLKRIIQEEIGRVREWE